MIANVADVMQYVFLIFSPFCLGYGSQTITHNEFVYQLKRKFLGRGVVVERVDVWSFSDGIAWHLVALAVHGVVWFVVNLVLESVSLRKTE